MSARATQYLVEQYSYLYTLETLFVALLQIEDLKTQLESCHQQLHDSNKHKQELEFQLRTALEREQDIRTGYISPVSGQSLCFSGQLHYLYCFDGKPCLLIP